ncbi:alpha-L-rhamnosidase C-terminal domain-containing protein [Luteolibacter sp. LG18]|uniref:alpha-L-rhamnosidase-related protein n=1 Tax=Luteolibacter sp. LG18 TaxID=2819286 RepID=UPI002B2F2DCB|nr:alpha-rhamnosidase [Luteolibacter sp. LG18]
MKRIVSRVWFGVTAMALSWQSFAQSEAHAKSRFAIIDPAYDALAVKPSLETREGSAPWLYGASELECWRLQVLRQRSQQAGLKVGYPGTFHSASPRAVFRLPVGGVKPPGVIQLRAVGEVTVTWDGREVYRAAATEAIHRITLPGDLKPGGDLEIALVTGGEPPALWIEDVPLATGKAAWRWSADGKEFSDPRTFPQTAGGVPPHRVEPGEIVLAPAGRDGELHDMGRVVFGRIAFACKGKPSLIVGESTAEARNGDPRHFEQSTALRDLGNGSWISEHPLAFRYFRVTGGEVSEVKCHALFSPVRYRGAFACSDERLTRIWMNSAYTLRLCHLDFLLDGVKRDRLPWVGDLSMSLMANAYTFGDGEIVRRSLVALGSAGIGKTHLNGIVDYSMWWVVAQDYYQSYYGDADHLRHEWPLIQDTLERLAAGSDANGFYVVKKGDWIFVDWVSQEKQTALQIVWWWAQASGAKLAERVGDTKAAARWRQRADALAKVLNQQAWDPNGGWRERPDGKSGPSRHANAYATMSGLSTPAQQRQVLAVLAGDQAKPVGTPYVAGFENMAIARLGDTATFFKRVDACWGGMLDRGATTFWEAWDPNQRGDDAYSFYKRPYAKSLCHAWSAGPAAFLPAEIFGLRPVADGWQRFSVEPRLGSLKWACATVPTPQGEIRISVAGSRMTLGVPAGTTAVWRGKSLAGPGHFTQSL